jgi:hypothetical protein
MSLCEQMRTDALEAQKFSRKHLVLELDFSEASIHELENLCDTVEYAIRGGKSPENIEMLTRVWGAYLGEAVRRATGAEWVQDSESGNRPCLKGSSGHRFFPHELVRSRLTSKNAEKLANCFAAARKDLQGS